MCGKGSLLLCRQVGTRPKELSVLFLFVSKNIGVAFAHSPWKKIDRDRPLSCYWEDILISLETGKIFPPLLWNRASSFWLLTNRLLHDLLFTLMLSGHCEPKIQLSRVAWQDSLGPHLLEWGGLFGFTTCNYEALAGSVGLFQGGTRRVISWDLASLIVQSHQDLSALSK